MLIDDSVIKVLFIIFVCVSFLYSALSPLPEEKDLPKEKRTLNILQAYLNTLKK